MALKKRLPTVVIFGRTNVGKSTLFNRLIEAKQAIVSDEPGTTRDSNINLVRWRGFSFELVDTGGIINPTQEVMFKKEKKKKTPANVDEIDLKVQKQAVSYLKKADLVLFVVDNQTGLLPQDRKMVSILFKNLSNEEKEKIILVANKIDSPKDAGDAAEFNKLGLGEPLLVSAASGSGTGDLLDVITKSLKKKKLTVTRQPDEDEGIKVCILGKPNVGKSSLLNAILGYEKVIVSPIPHTTREPQNTEMTYKDKKIILIDTAGISKQGNKSRGLERHGIEKSLTALEKADIALLVVDINEGLTHQDTKLAEEIIERGRSLLIVANKWDLVKERDTKKHTEDIYYSLPFASWAPIQFVSALTGEKVQKILDLVLSLDESRKTTISDSQMAHFLSRLVKIHRPAKGSGARFPHIYEIKQININPPRFIVRIGAVDTLHFSYLRFIKNKLREEYNFLGTPIKLKVRNNPLVHGRTEASSFGKKKRPIAGRPAPAPRGYRG